MLPPRYHRADPSTRICIQFCYRRQPAVDGRNPAGRPELTQA